MKLKLLLFVSFLLMSSILFAQEENNETKEDGGSLEKLSKKIANPLAQIWNLSFQQNFTTLKGMY